MQGKFVLSKDISQIFRSSTRGVLENVTSANYFKDKFYNLNRMICVFLLLDGLCFSSFSLHPIMHAINLCFKDVICMYFSVSFYSIAFIAKATIDRIFAMCNVTLYNTSTPATFTTTWWKQKKKIFNSSTDYVYYAGVMTKNIKTNSSTTFTTPWP